MSTTDSRGPITRGIAALSIITLTFLVTQVVFFVIKFIILYEVLNYSWIPSGPNPTPDSLTIPFFWVPQIISITLSLFFGWKFWNHRR